MIRETTGDIFESAAEVLVNPVNIVGVMGAGLAVRFKDKYPVMYREYVSACRRGWAIGKTLVHWARYEPRLLIICFPTKVHWRDPSRPEWIDAGLADLRLIIGTARIRSIAIPALGCGLGGLEWDTVRPLIMRRLGDLTDVDIELYAPGSETR